MNEQNLSKVVVPKNNGVLGDEVERLAKLKSDWMDRVARHFFPDHIYTLAKLRKRQKYVANWLLQAGYEVVEVPEEGLTQFCRYIDGKLTPLAEFQIEFRGKNS